MPRYYWISFRTSSIAFTNELTKKRHIVNISVHSTYSQRDFCTRQPVGVHAHVLQRDLRCWRKHACKHPRCFSYALQRTEVVFTEHPVRSSRES